MSVTSHLPVESFLESILSQLESSRRLVLTAEPGAGKSTLVPLALMRRAEGQILVLEPRRVAARLLARYVSEIDGTNLGDKVGYHVRFDRKAGEKTRLVYLTEGLLRRYIQADPFLAGVDTVVIDEFHERSLHADVSLMLLRKIQEELRPELKILVMSATLDASKASAYLHNAPIIEVPGRGFPVTKIHLPKIQNILDLEEISRKVGDALSLVFKDPRDDLGHVLVFLPGQREIRAVQTLLTQSQNSSLLQNPRDTRPSKVFALYSQLPEDEIRRALEPREDIRKIILATNIAESSVTLEGLSVVVDSGLQRRSNVSGSHLIPVLESTRISQASSEQRAGRAGRERPGRAYRLWSESDHRFLEPYETPEIQRSDPSTEILTLVDLGFSSVGTIPWLDPPRADALQSSQERLSALELISQNSEGADCLTPLGRKSLEFPVDLRASAFLARLLESVGFVDEPSLLRVCVLDLPPRDREGDLEKILEHHGSALRATPTYRSLSRSLGASFQKNASVPTEKRDEAFLRAHLDRLARIRKVGDEIKAQLWGQRGLRLSPEARSEIHGHDFLIALDLDDSPSTQVDSRLRSFCWVSRKQIETLLSDKIYEKSWAEKDSRSGGLRFWKAKFLGQLPLQEPSPAPADASLLKEHLVEEILRSWPEFESSESSLGQLLRRLQKAGYRLSPARLKTLLVGREDLPRDLSEVGEHGGLRAALEATLSYAELKTLNTRFPPSYKFPSGREKPLDYRADGRVFLSARLQDFLGLGAHPQIDQGRVALHLELLSPAGRPLQITQDLPQFWKGSYLEIRKEMKARYPRHAWPEDPTQPLPKT